LRLDTEINVLHWELVTYRFSDCYFVCAWWSFALLVSWLCKTHYVVIACFVCFAEI